MQLLVFDCVPEVNPGEVSQALVGVLEEQRIASVVYDDVNSPWGIGLLTWSEDPAGFVRAVRPALQAVQLKALRLRPDMTMFGRTYATGFEPDLRAWLLERPRRTVLNPDWPWAIWYPLRRKGAFEQLEPSDRGRVLREHALIGRAYGERDLAHDVRLACHGLDAQDNEFVVGLVGKDLHPLSHVVQKMRGTRQTSEYISKMGPFFVGYAAARVTGG
jgi:chlorite dismutase